MNRSQAMTLSSDDDDHQIQLSLTRKSQLEITIDDDSHDYPLVYWLSEKETIDLYVMLRDRIRDGKDLGKSQGGY